VAARFHYALSFFIAFSSFSLFPLSLLLGGNSPSAPAFGRASGAYGSGVVLPIK
jgi:hypothetical protein